MTLDQQKSILTIALLAAFADGNKDDAEREEIEATLIQLQSHIARQLASDDEPEVPCELDLGDEPDDSDLRGWCIGFMEGVFLREAVWFEDAEDEVSELLLPIMVGSGLFDEQPEFDEIARDRHLVDESRVQVHAVSDQLDGHPGVLQ